MSGDTGRVHMTKDELYKTCDELCCVRRTLIDERSELRNKLFAEQADNARLRAERDELLASLKETLSLAKAGSEIIMHKSSEDIQNSSDCLPEIDRANKLLNRIENPTQLHKQ